MHSSRRWIPVALAISAIAGTTLISNPAGAIPKPTTATRLVLSSTGDSPDAAVGDSGLGLPGGISATTGSATQWVAFESVASDLVAADTVATSDVFVTDGSTVTRLSVMADGTPVEGTNSYDPSICSSGRKVVFTTDAELSDADVNGADDVYVIDRDADDDGILDEFLQNGAVTLTLVSAEWDSEAGEFVSGFGGASQGSISADCTTAVFVTEDEYTEDDFNFLPDVYARDLTDLEAPVERVSAPAAEGGEGGGFLPAMSEDGSKVAFVTEGADLVSEDGTRGGIVVRDRSTQTTGYVTVTPAGNASTGNPDTEYPPSISDDGTCVAFKSNRGFDLLAGDTAPTDGVFVWQASGAVELISIDETGFPGVEASAPQISGDCRFVGFQSDDEFLVSNDDNGATDVFVYDRESDTIALVSDDGADASSDGDTNLGDLVWDSTSGTGQVLVTSSATTLVGADGDTSEIDLFRIGFISADVPGQPAQPTGVPGNGQAIVSWTAPAANGSPITSYVVRSTPGNQTCTWSSGPLSCTVTGLTNGTGYTFTVRASNELGAGQVSPASSTVIPRTVPGAVTGLAAIPGKASVKLTWSAPASSGGAQITAYRVQRSTDGNNWTTVTSSAPTTRTFDVTGLTNGTSYSFRVAAINAAGPGSNSSVVKAIPRTVPGAPTKLVGKPGDKQVTLTWKAPSNTGGAAITKYKVQLSTDGKKWTTSTSNAPTSRTFTVKNLTNGKAYSFRVAATNAAGTGAYSSVAKSTPKK